jgi:hypothetical protein
VSKKNEDAIIKLLEELVEKMNKTLRILNNGKDKEYDLAETQRYYDYVRKRINGK